MENTNLVKLKFLRNGEPSGKEYTYISKSEVAIGDTVIVREAEEGKEAPKGIITAVNVPESEVESFKDKLKAIVGKVEETVNIEELDQETLCKYCNVSNDCPGPDVKGGPDGPIYPPCTERDISSLFDKESYLEDLKETT